MNDLNERINLNVDLTLISKEICQNYNLGKFISNNIITVGYEDFNYILVSSTGKYCIKIFNKNRTDNDCEKYIDRIELSNKLEVNSPKALNINNELLYNLNLNNQKYRICVFEYIDGHSFFELDEIPNKEEIKDIIKQMSIIHNSELESEFIYDCWTITNFDKEFEDKKRYVNDNDLKTLEKVYERFSKVDLHKLPYSFVHGDIISTNVLKDKNNKLWIIDYAVSNYLPRIVDLAVSSCNLCLDPNNEYNTKEKISFIISEYQKYNKLTDYEKEVLPIFFDLANAMGILQTCYQNGIGNYSNENDFWLNESRKGLEFSTQEFWNDILNKKI